MRWQAKTEQVWSKPISTDIRCLPGQTIAPAKQYRLHPVPTNAFLLELQKLNFRCALKIGTVRLPHYGSATSHTPSLLLKQHLHVKLPMCSSFEHSHTCSIFFFTALRNRKPCWQYCYSIERSRIIHNLGGNQSCTYTQFGKHYWINSAKILSRCKAKNWSKIWGFIS